MARCLPSLNPKVVIHQERGYVSRRYLEGEVNMSAMLLILTAAIFAATAFALVGGVRQAQAEGWWPERIM